jgi:hypothetical protein
VTGNCQIHFVAIASEASKTGGMEVPVHVVGTIPGYLSVLVMVVHQTHQCTNLWRQDKRVAVSQISFHLEWSKLIELRRKRVEGTLDSLIIGLGAIISPICRWLLARLNLLARFICREGSKIATASHEQNKIGGEQQSQY